MRKLAAALLVAIAFAVFVALAASTDLRDYECSGLRVVVECRVGGSK